jgi:DNA (cytosine-5)-methyltransferase 1
MIGMTLCSGIGAPEMAAPWVDWRLASEIEAFPRAVLQARFGYRTPGDHNQGDPLLWGDMTEVGPDLLRERGIPLPDIIVAGTPCQSFSVAGLRKGTEDPRGNLTLAFVEICHAIVDARPDGKLTVLWENVPGVLSDKGNAFGAFLGGLVGALDALPQPAGGSWPGEGMVEGPRARAAWSVLDAQWFGVAQRRRRVFVVVDFGGAVDPAAVLLEPDRLRGDTPPRREAGQDVTGTLSARTEGGGGLGTDFDLAGGVQPEWPAKVAPTLNAHFGDKMGLEDQHALSGGVCLFPPETSMCLNAGAMGRQDAETETLIPTSGGGFDVAHTLKGEGFDASEDGTGRGTPLVPVAIQERAVSENPDNGPQGAGVRQDGVAFTLEARNKVQAVAFALTTEQTPKFNENCALTLTKQSPTGGGQPQAVVAFDLRGREGGAMPEGPHDTANLRAASGGSSRSYIAQPWAVRRLTPTECARLQGFPDDHTQIEWRGKPADQCPDGPQYKAYGNSMAVPVIRWIMDRMRISMDGEKKINSQPAKEPTT